MIVKINETKHQVITKLKDNVTIGTNGYEKSTDRLRLGNRSIMILNNLFGTEKKPKHTIKLTM